MEKAHRGRRQEHGSASGGDGVHEIERHLIHRHPQDLGVVMDDQSGMRLKSRNQGKFLFLGTRKSAGVSPCR